MFVLPTRPEEYKVRSCNPRNPSLARTLTRIRSLPIPQGSVAYYVASSPTEVFRSNDVQPLLVDDQELHRTAAKRARTHRPGKGHKQ